MCSNTKYQLRVPNITFLPHPLPSANKKLPCESSPVLVVLYLYSSGSAYVTAPIKEICTAKSLPTLNGHIYISQTVLTFTICLCINVTLPCFKQLPLNVTCGLVLI